VRIAAQLGTTAGTDLPVVGQCVRKQRGVDNDHAESLDVAS